MLKENRRPWPRRPNLTPLRVFCAVLATGALALLCAVAYMEAHFRLAPETVEGYAGAAGPLAFTLRINTFRRDDLLRGALEHYSRCANVEEITVVWSDQARSPPDASGWSLAPEPRARVEFERHAADRLSNRFRPLKAPPTEAILSLDDDVLLDCRSLDRARDAWESAKSSLVGFSPRLHTWDPAQRRFTYRSWWYVYWTGRYSIMLTKCAFLHRDLLHRFHELPSDLVDFVDEQRNCEDILMVSLSPSLSANLC
mmetsp:Transcript_32818/g.103910  ORF Transcript_32818/g.103910 Transcript_32818/m.103910 type:complete len:255 (-) Transcript_32818:404-1168(-)